MSAEVTQHRWTEKTQLSRHFALALAGVVALAFSYFKIRPYLGSEEKVHPYQGQDQANHRSANAERKEKELKDFNLNQFIPHLGIPNVRGSGSGAHVSRARIIERPLFDGLPVTVRAMLIRGISSLESDPKVEARFDSLLKGDETAELDDASVRGSKLIGIATANLDLKRIMLSFSELITPEGRSIPVQAIAIDSETQTQGISANYTSGMGTRLLGVGISQVLTAGDQILMAKALPDPSSANLTQQATAQAARQMNDQAATDLSLEATKGMRETKPELSIPAGTILTIRLRVAPQGSEIGGGL